jgi:hypothetical protein
MTLHQHLRLLIIVTAAWLLFWVGGLPDYYRQYSTSAMIMFAFAVLPPLWYLGYRSIAKSKNPMASSRWLSFYSTAPLFLYDLLYCGFYLGSGVAFLWEYWYLTVYYAFPWLIFPVTGWRLEQQSRQGTV